jgi:hypothetical protein
MVLAPKVIPPALVNLALSDQRFKTSGLRRNVIDVLPDDRLPRAR